jgi:UDP-4-amino-4,6-dideoxy-N-acetyl-beta-L-altrosamine N-acetyltransferase
MADRSRSEVPESVRALDVISPWSRYGVTFERLGRQHLELLRGWRNDPEIQQFMVYREHITAEMQERWFASIDDLHNFYSVIFHRGVPVGYSHTKNVDYRGRSGEGGMVICSPAHRHGLVPFRAALAGTDWVFDRLGLRQLTGRVLRSNHRALRYDRALGYRFEPPTEGSEVLVGTLTVEAYARATATIRAVIERAGDDDDD